MPGREPRDDARVEVFELVGDVDVGVGVGAGERSGGKPGGGARRGDRGRPAGLDALHVVVIFGAMLNHDGISFVVGVGR